MQATVTMQRISPLTTNKQTNKRIAHIFQCATFTHSCLFIVPHSHLNSNVIQFLACVYLLILLQHAGNNLTSIPCMHLHIFQKEGGKTTGRKKQIYSCTRRLNSLQVHKVAQRVVFNIYPSQKYAHVPLAAAELEMHQCVVSLLLERRMTPSETGQRLAF